MATIRLLSWNIEHLGPGKFIDAKTNQQKNPNFWPLLQLIADTIYHADANIVCILELAPSTAHGIINCILALLNAWGAPWRSVFIPTHKTDVYCILYKTGQGFDVLTDPHGNPLCGYTNLDAAQNPLTFHSAKTQNGGRYPGYVAFTTTDRTPLPELLFTVICYHAMFNPGSNHIGLSSVPQLGPVTTVSVAGVARPVACSFICGDFNVDYLTDPNSYNTAAALGSTAILPGLGASAKSTLVNATQHGGWANTVDYRCNAYDNIFARNPTTPAANSQVIDMLAELLKDPGLKPSAERFNPAHVGNGGLLAPFGNWTNEDAWHLYWDCVSNHLPVVASFGV